MKLVIDHIRLSKSYVLNIFIYSVLVCFCAFIEYQIVEKETFSITQYIIPLIVGAFFGYLTTVNRRLFYRLKDEKKEVQEKNKQIHTYIGTIVHDLKSPVAAISGLANLCIKTSKDLNEDQKMYLKFIQDSSNSMLENIAILLDNSRIESGNRINELEVGNPYFTIQSTIDKYLIEALNKSISIQRIIDKNLPLVAYDKDLLDRILSNLISNAIKYSPPNTQIKIFTEVLAERLSIKVKDEGLGMSEEDLGNAFQEFKKLSARPTGHESSTGLGLSITKKLIKELGGEIVARSDGKNMGTEFEFTLNIKDANSHLFQEIF
ncbi:MAG: HAMP domain-containing sensor histidine kinase [Sediminibacterium sp.]